MKNKRFYGLYCGYSQEDIKEIINNIQRDGITSLMDNYVLKSHHDDIVMEDKWESESPRRLHGEIDKMVIDAISIEYINKPSRFQSLKKLTDYMVREEEADMEEYLRNEEEWEY